MLLRPFLFILIFCMGVFKADAATPFSLSSFSDDELKEFLQTKKSLCLRIEQASSTEVSPDRRVILNQIFQETLNRITTNLRGALRLQGDVLTTQNAETFDVTLFEASLEVAKETSIRHSRTWCQNLLQEQTDNTAKQKKFFDYLNNLLGLVTGENILISHYIVIEHQIDEIAKINKDFLRMIGICGDHFPVLESLSCADMDDAQRSINTLDQLQQQYF